MRVTLLVLAVVPEVLLAQTSWAACADAVPRACLSTAYFVCVFEAGLLINQQL